MAPQHRQRTSDQPFDAPEEREFFRLAERNGDARLGSPGCPANAVNVVLRVPGQLIVDDVGDAVDVDTASYDVGGDHDPGVNPFLS
jgi:hypothetical protein